MNDLDKRYPTMPSLSASSSSTSITKLAERSQDYNPLLASPISSKKGKERVVYGDRFIPNRDGTDLSTTFHLLSDSANRLAAAAPSSNPNSAKRKLHRGPECDAQKEEANKTFNALLKSELFGSTAAAQDPSTSIDNSFLTHSPSSSRYAAGNPSVSSAAAVPTTPTRTKNLFSYSSPSKSRASGGSGSANTSAHKLDSPTHERYSASPVRYESQKLLLSPKKTPRTLSKVPFKVLDAPELADDFYLNLVDWSSTNILAVGLGACVYLWSAQTSTVTKLCDLAEINDSVTSLGWIQKGSKIAVGTNSGTVRIYDAVTQTFEREMTGHSARVGTLAWNDYVLTTGSRDRSILHRDVRQVEHSFRRLTGHRQEVCGIKWSPSGTQMASGGNDNKLLVWDNTSSSTLYRFSEHVAAVKAITWNTHQHGILASGGGTADKKIRFWNTLTGSLLSEVDTGSQVCNLMWSKNSNELVSTHGFSQASQVQNQVCVWKYPSMQQVATLTGHTYRVLYLAMSPDGQTIVTGAGDETLRFWNAFAKGRTEKKGEAGMLNPFAKIR